MHVIKACFCLGIPAALRQISSSLHFQLDDFGRTSYMKAKMNASRKVSRMGEFFYLVYVSKSTCIVVTMNCSLYKLSNIMFSIFYFRCKTKIITILKLVGFLTDDKYQEEAEQEVRESRPRSPLREASHIHHNAEPGHRSRKHRSQHSKSHRADRSDITACWVLSLFKLEIWMIVCVVRYQSLGMTWCFIIGFVLGKFHISQQSKSNSTDRFCGKLQLAGSWVPSSLNHIC